jgi:hypothetical protein
LMTKVPVVWEVSRAERFFDSIAAVPRERDEKKNPAAIPLRMTTDLH